MADARIVSAREPFTADIDGAPVPVGTGDLFYADDAVVQGREHLFGEARVRRTRPRPAPVTEPQGVETADAAPGTRRATTRRPGHADVSTAKDVEPEVEATAGRDARGVDTAEAVAPEPVDSKPDAVKAGVRPKGGRS